MPKSSGIVDEVEGVAHGGGVGEDVLDVESFSFDCHYEPVSL